MKKLIAFVSQISVDEQKDWQLVLSKKFQQVDCAVEIKLFSQLSHEEKSRCDVAIVANPNIAELAQLVNLTWVHSVWAGVDAMLQAFVSPSGPPTPHYKIVRLTDPFLADTMSEAVLAWVLYLHRDMPRYQQQQQKKVWQQHSYKLPHDRTVGILGLGKLGLKSAERLLQNGFNVLGWSRQLKDITGIKTLAEESGLEFLLANSDIIINLLPLTPATKGLLNKDRFLFCQHAALINFGRGATQVEADLLAALEAEQLSHAVLDVFDLEPLPVSHPFWQHEKITVLPHISAPTSISSASKIVADNIKKYFLTREIPTTVDPATGY